MSDKKYYNLFSTQRNPSCKEGEGLLFILDEFPKNRNGKIDIEKLKNIYSQNEYDLNKEGAACEKILQIASKTFRINANKLDPNELSQNTPGWDSMAHLDLITRTEKAFGLEISGHQAMEIKTLNDLMNIVEEKMTVS